MEWNRIDYTDTHDNGSHIITDIDIPEISITTDSIKIMKSERIDGN